MPVPCRRIIVQRTTLLCGVFAWCVAGLVGHEAALAQPRGKAALEQFANPIPPDCHIPPKDLEPPDLPPDMNKVVRIVTINGYFQPELSTGSPEDMRNAKVSVEPKRGGYAWGKKCRGRVKFLFLSETGKPAPKTPSIPGGSTSSPPSSTGGSSTTQGSSGAPGHTVPGASGSTPPSTTSGQRDRPPATSPAPTTTTPPSSQAPVQTGGSDPCGPPPATPPRTVLVPEVKFLVERCTSVTSTCSATAKSGSGSSDCVTQCLQWSDPAIQGAPREKETIGLILPGGDRIEWGRGVAEGAQFSWFKYPDQGEEISGPVLELGQFSNGVAVREVEYGRYSTEVPVSLLPVWSSSTTAATKPKVTSTIKPIPIIKLNGSEQFKHLWYTDDNGQFTLSFANNAKAAGPSGAASMSATGGCPSGGNMVVELTLKKVQPSLLEEAQPFFEGVETQTFTLAPQETKELTGTLKKLLESIKTYKSDILFGARIAIKVWEEHKPETLLEDLAFGVYRFLDVADDEHKDGVVEMARTLADGPDKVVRLRELAMQVHPDAAVKFDSDNPQEFRVREEQGATSFRFDPKHSDRRERVSGTLVLSAKQDNRRIGSLRFKGTGELQNRIVFDVAKFIRALEKVVIIAKDPRNAQANPPSYMVHPALVPSEEWKEFDSPSKQAALAADIKARMQFLWEEAGLMPGIRWETRVDPENTVDFDFQLRENNDPKGGFPRAVTPGGADNLDAIREIVRDKDQWNKAELAFRLSKAINPGYKQTIEVWPDSLLEGIPPSPNNRVILTREQIVNAFAKTMVHEIGHSWSLDHPVKADLIPARTTLQQLVLKQELSRTATFQLSFHGQTTKPLPYFETDPATGANRQVSGSTIWPALLNLSSIGFENYTPIDPEWHLKKTPEFKATNRYGVFVYRCTYVLKNAQALRDEATNTGSEEAQSANLERVNLLIDRCNATPVNDRYFKFFIEFANHLRGADVDPITIIPSDAGAIALVEKGEKTFKVQTKNNKAGAKVRAIIDGYSEADVFSDLMADINDAAGDLKFREGLSLEPLKMALALNYTKEEVEKMVVKLYSAMDQAYARWETVSGFEGAAVKLAVKQ